MAAETPFVDAVGVGLNTTDTLILLPHFPAFDSKVEFTGVEVLPGGQAASAMVACQSWGLRTRYVGKVGDDGAAELQRRELTRARVEAHLLRVVNCASQAAFILVDQLSGERTILWRRDARLALRPEELRREWIVRARALLVDGHDAAAAAAAAAWAHQAGVAVAADLDNLYPGVEALLENVDYLLASRNFPARLTGEANLLRSLPAIRSRYGCRVTGATLGREGALAWDGGQFHYSPGYRVRAVDTTGAGDVFHGALVYALLQAWPLGRQLDFACAAAALNCTAVGARGGIRPLEEIERLMREGTRHATAFDQRELQRYAPA
ncbi:MAG TPA: PfkB family carbohydrate kinase [Candidatus Acidoferrales bacterium]|jgi:sulfofructose kinase|nr:PfkB family carbohydrate kinase [Candidatus Acidoferrales bacterium]